MTELSTLGAVIAAAYEDQPDRNAFTDAEKVRVDGMAAVATSGSYLDLANRPTLSAAATSGSYADLTGKPALDFVPLTQRAAANGVATLDASGKVPMIQLNVSGLSFKGAWNPTTNSPQLIDGAGSVGDFYKASTSGTFNFGNGSYTFNMGDWAIFAAGVWQRIGSSELVASVNGKIGDVVLNASDVGARPSSYVPAWSEVTTKPTLTNTVNGQSGTVVINAASVGARPSSYVPTWAEVTGKPAVRGTIGPAIPAVLARLSANQNIPNDSLTRLVPATLIYDQFSMSVGDGTFVIPAWATHARIMSSVQFWGNAQGERQVVHRLNNANTHGLGFTRQRVDVLDAFVLSTAGGVVPVTAGQTLSLSVLQSSGGILAVQNTQSTWVCIELFGAAT